MPTGIRFVRLQSLARERGYGVGRRGREVLWWRNEDPDTTYTSSGVAEARDDIILDHSSEKRRPRGKTTTTGETK
jgi:hypothetical protein